MTRIIENLSEISANYDAVFCDLWGCLHNGVEPFQAAVDALYAFKKSGGIVHLLTNSPRPAASVYPQLDQIGVPRDLYQGITASGDASRAALASGAYGKKVFHIGPDRDEAFFAGVETEISIKVSMLNASLLIRPKAWFAQAYSMTAQKPPPITQNCC